MAYGLSWMRRCVPYRRARGRFGLADQVGTLRPGIEANVVVWTGDPFEFSTRAEHVSSADGLHGTDPGRLLTARYRQLPPR